MPVQSGDVHPPEAPAVVQKNIFLDSDPELGLAPVAMSPLSPGHHPGLPDDQILDEAEAMAFSWGDSEDATLHIQILKTPNTGQFGGVSMLHKLHPFAESHEQEDPGWRLRLGQILESNTAHYIIVFLLVLDVLLVGVSGVLERLLELSLLPPLLTCLSCSPSPDAFGIYR